MEKAIAFRTIMNAPHRDHPEEDALERFLMNQSGEEELEAVETHILACEACVTRLETLELNIAATKLALQSVQAEEAKKLAAARTSSWTSWFTLPRLSWAGAAMAACAVVISVASVPRDVTLTAYRGSETNAVAEWRPLKMHLNARDLPAGPVSVQLVDHLGAEIWRGQSSIKAEEINVRMPRLTKEGTYYVRVYSLAPDAAASELEREFSIQAKPLF